MRVLLDTGVMGEFHSNPFVGLYLCTTGQHRPVALVLATMAALLAGSVGVLGIRRARRQHGTGKYVWAAVAGLSLGAGGWSAHHIALLGYVAGVPLAFRLGLSAASQMLVLCTGLAATMLLVRARSRIALIAASLIHGAGLAVMHYTAMAAVEVPATMRWNPEFVVLSLASAIALSYPTLRLAMFGRRNLSAAGAVSCFGALVFLTHMNGMAALSLVPARTRTHDMLISAGDLAAWIGIVSLGLLTVGLANVLYHRRGRAAVERAERQFSILVKSTRDYAICMLDRDGRISQWNGGVQSLTGYDAEDVIGMSFARFFTLQDRADAVPEQALQAAAEGGICKGDWICERRDGTHFWADGTIEKICDEDGRHLGFSLILHDATRIRRAQDLVAQTTQRLDTALENMHEGLCLFDADERLVLSNRRFRELWNLDEDVCRPGTPLGRLIIMGFMNPDDSVRAAERLWEFRRILGDAVAEQQSVQVVVELGEHRVVSIANSALPEGGWVTTCTDITEKRRSEAQIEHMALHDALTGLPNRTGFYQRLDQDLEQASGKDTRLALVVMGLDRFKEINDTYGHRAGDEVLRTVAARLVASSRGGETIARIGGDEFAAATVFTNSAQLDEFVTRMLGCIATPIQDGNNQLTANASLGVALYPEDGTTREVLLNNASLVLYRAKATVGQNVCYFEPGMDEAARLRRQLAHDLRHAIANGELKLLYQPQLSLGTGVVCGYEALLRWNHPVRGQVPPDEFIPIAEETGDILEIGEWVLREACREARHWPADRKVAVNLSAVQLLQQDLTERVRAVLVETGLSPFRLELEITETAIISDKLRALHCLRQLKAMGISIAIDDFGTGYSSLDTLHSFPFDKIKIDKSFLARAECSSQARAIIRTVLALGKSLDIPVLAEGVENASQMQVLQTEGCSEAQGYFFGRPAPAPSLDLRNAANG